MITQPIVVALKADADGGKLQARDCFVLERCVRVSPWDHLICTDGPAVLSAPFSLFNTPELSASP